MIEGARALGREDPDLAAIALSRLRREGLDCSGVEVDGSYPTGFQLKARCDDGSDPAVEYFRRGSAASRLSPALLRPGSL